MYKRTKLRSEYKQAGGADISGRKISTVGKRRSEDKQIILYCVQVNSNKHKKRIPLVVIKIYFKSDSFFKFKKRHSGKSYTVREAFVRHVCAK